MKKHLIVIFLLIITIPVMGLGYAGRNVLDEDYAYIEDHFTRMVMQRMQSLEEFLVSSGELDDLIEAGGEKQISTRFSDFMKNSYEEGMRLVGPGERALYSWGRFENLETSEVALTRQFPAPYQDYRLDYFMSAVPDLSRSLRFQLYVQLGAIALMLFFLGIYIYDAVVLANKKVSFVNQISHELKTPLTNIRMYAELLSQSFADDVTALQKIDVILSESQRLSRLITNMLTLSSQDEIKLNPQIHDMDDLIKNVLTGFAPRLEQLEMDVQLDLQGGTATFDRDSMEQVLVNLISNVEKYAAEGKKLSIGSWRDEEDILHVRVQDYGPGIPTKMRERIFEPFVRIHDNIEGISGAGIGLALARDLVRKNGGDLKIVEGGKGACFEVTL